MPNRMKKKQPAYELCPKCGNKKQLKIICPHCGYRKLTSKRKWINLKEIQQMATNKQIADKTRRQEKNKSKAKEKSKRIETPEERYLKAKKAEEKAIREQRKKIQKAMEIRRKIEAKKIADARRKLAQMQKQREAELLKNAQSLTGLVDTRHQSRTDSDQLVKLLEDNQDGNTIKCPYCNQEIEKKHIKHHLQRIHDVYERKKCRICGGITVPGTDYCYTHSK